MQYTVSPHGPLSTNQAPSLQVATVRPTPSQSSYAQSGPANEQLLPAAGGSLGQMTLGSPPLPPSPPAPPDVLSVVAVVPPPPPVLLELLPLSLPEVLVTAVLTVAWVLSVALDEELALVLAVCVLPVLPVLPWVLAVSAPVPESSLLLLLEPQLGTTPVNSPSSTSLTEHRRMDLPKHEACQAPTRQDQACNGVPIAICASLGGTGVMLLR